MIMDIEFRRPEKSMIAQAQQRAAPQDKTDQFDQVSRSAGGRK
jgi:hypothetical protein